ncbi:MAG TPA: cytochrome P450, partial [Dehalococcoidia bacterium]|nr:cytochrome P450 [Dehalococcoidia bacterium]
GDVLNEQELLANAMLLLAAGHETTTNLIANGLLALLQHPDQLRLLRDDPTLIEGAVEECLRYYSPVQLTTRLVRDDLVLGGKQIWHNQTVVLLTGAANRDPAQFPDPDRFDITRIDNRHLAFGHGPHFCLGAPLARLEGQIAIGTVIRRMPDLRLTQDRIEWHPVTTFRGLKALEVAF